MLMDEVGNDFGFHICLFLRFGGHLLLAPKLVDSPSPETSRDTTGGAITAERRKRRGRVTLRTKQ